MITLRQLSDLVLGKDEERKPESVPAQCVGLLAMLVLFALLAVACGLVPPR